MSRTPPASIRLTSGSLNYDQVAASTYYYQSHLKEGLSLESVVRMLAYNVGFLTARQKRKELPLIVMGVLPIYTQLRAKKWYHRYLSKSVYWFTTKLFRGAHSDSLHYHNNLIYKQHQKPLAPSEMVTKNGFNQGPTVDEIQKLVAPQKKDTQGDPYNNWALMCQFRQKSAFWSKSKAGSKGEKRLFNVLPPRFSAWGKKQKGPQKSRGKQTSFIKDRCSIFPKGSYYDTFSVSPVPFFKKEKNLFLQDFVDSLFATKHKKAHIKQSLVHRGPQRNLSFLRQQRSKRKKININSYQRSAPGAWQKKNLFALFCLEQIISKSKNVGCSFRPMPGDSITKRFSHGHKRMFKKTFYDVQIIRQLTPECHLKIRKGYTIPRSQIDKLKPILMDKDGRRVTLPLRPSDGGIQLLEYSKQNHELIECFDFNRCVRQSKTNTIPKFWVSRQFNAYTKLNLFTIVEGRYCRSGHVCPTPFQRDSPMSSYFAGWKQLKSSFVFEFNVLSNDTIRSLRPTVSLRF